MNLQVSFYDEADRRQRPAGIYTVQFNVLSPDARYKKVNPTATVTWSSEGNGVQRRLSVVDGASISGVADHVTVRVVDETADVGGDMIATPVDYFVTILVAPFPRPARGAPPYLRGTAVPVVVAGGASSALAVPNDSGVTTACILAVAEDGGLPRVTQRSFDPGIVFSRYVPDNSSWVGLFPQTVDLLLENVSIDPASTVTYSALWGIDG